jgi:hypothetical protein
MKIANQQKPKNNNSIISKDRDLTCGAGRENKSLPTQVTRNSQGEKGSHSHYEVVTIAIIIISKIRVSQPHHNCARTKKSKKITGSKLQRQKATSESTCDMI